MSLNLIPGRRNAKHRGKSGLQLQRELAAAEREANDRTCQMVAMATEIDELRAERNQLANRLDETAVANQATIDDLTAERDGLAEELAALKVKFGAQLAAEANANRINVPPMVRDTSAIEDQATGPIDVRTLWAARDAGLLGPDGEQPTVPTDVSNVIAIHPVVAIPGAAPAKPVFEPLPASVDPTIVPASALRDQGVAS